MIRCLQIRKKLLAYSDGELESDSALAVWEHLEVCRRCRKDFEEISHGIFLAEHLSLPTIPQLSWGEFERVLAETSNRPEATARRKGLIGIIFRPAPLVAVLVLFALLSYLALRTSRVNPVDLDGYLNQIETSSADVAHKRIADPPVGFHGTGEHEALEAAGIENVSALPPLPGYALVEHRILRAPQGRVVQLVYANAKDSFAVFVAPSNLPFFFGKREKEQVQLKGMPCDEISCPRTAALVFGANRFHCVLISKSTNRDELATIVQYFVAAHRSGVK